MADSLHHLYPVWNAMLARCCLPSNPWYKDYGGRGITVCDEWKESFKRFVIDMGERPKNYTLERNDNDGPYCKENCAWVSQSEQNRNQRRRKTALEDEKILEIFYSYLPTMMTANKYGVDKRTVGKIKNLKNGEYSTRICRTYKLVDGQIVLKD